MSVQPFLIAAAGLFSIGIYGILVRRNVVMILLSIELILNAVNINTTWNALYAFVHLSTTVLLHLIAPVPMTTVDGNNFANKTDRGKCTH